jgi:predicted nucleotidyltransferase
MNTHKDFEEFLRLLREEGVEFVIVGGYAVAFHGYARATNDMDLFYRNTEANIRRLCRALDRFGFSTPESAIKEFAEPGVIIRIGVPPVRLELINTISGLAFDEVWERRVEDEYGDAPASFISFGDLLANKKASGRPKDLADFDELGGNRVR